MVCGVGFSWQNTKNAELCPLTVVEHWPHFVWRTVQNPRVPIPHFSLLPCAAILVVLGAIGCASISTPPATYGAPGEIELFLARGSSEGRSYESYLLRDHSLLIECGDIQFGRQIPQFQDVAVISDQQADSISALTSDLGHELERHNWMLDSPGDADGFFDPGQFFLSLRNFPKRGDLELKTSLDSVSQPAKGITRDLKKFAQSVRALPSSPPCSNRNFFGIESDPVLRGPRRGSGNL